jgi:restriction endonuclease S subunit
MMRQNVSGVLSINRGELEQVEIPLISLEQQRQIVGLYALYEKETNILEQIKKTRKRLINSVLSQMVKE